jgi:hypothetical protein
MKRILIFVVILLTTFSIVNAVNIPLRKRAIAFAACPSGSPQFNAASIDPDPPVAGKTATAKFSVSLPAEFVAKGKFTINAAAEGGESLDGFPKDEDVCTIDGITCPIPAGSTVDFETPVEIPKGAPDSYTLQYSLVDGAGKEIACSSGPVTGAPKGGDAGKDAGKGDGGPPPGAPAAPGGGKGPDDGGKGPDDGGKGPDDGGKGPDDGGKGPDDGGKGPDADAGKAGKDGGKGGKGDDGGPLPPGAPAAPGDGDGPTPP